MARGDPLERAHKVVLSVLTDPREREVMRSVLRIGDVPVDRSPKAIGQRLGCDEYEVRRLETKARGLLNREFRWAMRAIEEHEINQAKHSRNRPTTGQLP